jgi:hypothetical protein
MGWFCEFESPLDLRFPVVLVGRRHYVNRISNTHPHFNQTLAGFGYVTASSKFISHSSDSDGERVYLSFIHAHLQEAAERDLPVPLNSAPFSM